MNRNEGNKKYHFNPQLLHVSKARNLKFIHYCIYHFDILVVRTCKVRLWNINIILSISFHKETHISYIIFYFFNLISSPWFFQFSLPEQKEDSHEKVKCLCNSSFIPYCSVPVYGLPHKIFSFSFSHKNTFWSVSDIALGELHVLQIFLTLLPAHNNKLLNSIG